jgi:hypothetical protein
LRTVLSGLDHDVRNLCSTCIVHVALRSTGRDRLIDLRADALAPVAQVDGDAQLLGLWLHGRSAHTQRAYRSDVDSFLRFVRKSLRTVTVGDVQAWMDTLEEHLAQLLGSARLGTREAPVRPAVGRQQTGLGLRQSQGQ